MDYLEKIDKFLETYNLSQLNQNETGNLNNLITNNEAETVIKQLPTNKRTGPDGFIGKFSQIFKAELITIFSNYSKTLKRKELFQTHSTWPPLF